ncbi:hypothetical protein F7725_007473 [Dissostichus mawsoni]|uniref:Uncharacterized protein n=1 Tax=Dissostichus mawsoni TaxID=36200 RepID=A0A7J5Y4K4_DISMA|nr:hypothetical protein F7725_007473 [Dissostichus mawsoni]
MREREDKREGVREREDEREGMREREDKREGVREREDEREGMREREDKREGVREREDEREGMREGEKERGRRKAPRVDAPDTDCEMVFAPETVECFLQDLQLSLSDASGDELETSAPTAPLMASLDWGTRKSLFLERWKTERPRLINSTAAQENVANRICQQCGSNPAAVRCRDCRPPFPLC